MFDESYPAPEPEPEPEGGMAVEESASATDVARLEKKVRASPTLKPSQLGWLSCGWVQVDLLAAQMDYMVRSFNAAAGLADS